MTRPTKRASTNTVTVWPVLPKSNDPFAPPQGFATPYKFLACFEKGTAKQYSDARGVLFVPRSIYWFELDSNGAPQNEWYIALGDHTLETDPRNINGAELIRSVKLQDGLRQTDDVMVLT